ncbi:MAG: phenylalanine--tRNA ligase subunit beta, partial [Patescibacteria group bacterium]
FTEKDPQRIADHLTVATAEVEWVEMQGALLDRCVVGRVTELRKHPNADKLSICMVETDQGKKKVVCGGTNLRDGMLIAFAHVGAKVKSEEGGVMELQKVKIRGEESEGMICAAAELALEGRFSATPSQGNRPIVELSPHFKVGIPLRTALDLTDTILHIDNHAITHRADLFSHIGIARECVALGMARWKKRPVFKIPRFTKAAVPFKFIVEEKKLMPRYCACTIDIDNLGETPEWMKRRLHAVGWRSLNLPIDITNYVASEVGVPLHSFDVRDIRGTVHMRKAKKGEKIVTLDRKEFSLPEGALILSDDEGIFDLLGIMGGLRSSMKEGTKHMYLHSASLDPLSIRRTVIATGHRTDAATVYEKGVQPITTEQGFYRALELFLAHVPGARVTSRMESSGENGRAKALVLSVSGTSSLLGKEITAKEVTKSLSNLEFFVKKKTGDLLHVTPPLHRLGDIRIPADLVEEVARMQRFDLEEPTPPTASIRPPSKDPRLSRMRSTLKEEGFREIVTLSLLGEALLRKSGFDTHNLRELENPLGEDLKYLRPSLLPHLLEIALKNLELEDESLHFEVGHVFEEEKEEISLMLLVAERHAGTLGEEPFLRAKQALNALFSAMHYAPSFESQKTGASYTHPARVLSLLVDGKYVGELFEVHPNVSRTFGFRERVAAAELSLSKLLSLPWKDTTLRSIPQFPSIRYDTTVPVPTNVSTSSLLAAAKKTSPLLQDVRIHNLYQRQKGEQRHITFRCIYSSPDRTLTEEEVKPVHALVEKILHG